MKFPHDITNIKFERLTPVKKVGRTNKYNSIWLCKCDCGNTVEVRRSNLVSGTTKSCGCLKLEMLTIKNTSHGKTNTKEHYTWRAMKQRCQNKNNPQYKDYGGRGIDVCERWEKFSNFLEDMDEQPDGMSLERINNNKGYSKENCRWATKEDQQNNTRRNHLLEYNGKTQTVTQWSRELNIPPSTIFKRLTKGCSIDEALFTGNLPRGSLLKGAIHF